ncbi:ribonuclease H-like domain-containing protein [Tanacetum coccineum]
MPDPLLISIHRIHLYQYDVLVLADIYLCPFDARFPNHVCFQRSLYGLKQAPRAWFQRFVGYATRTGFYYSRCDSSLFIYSQGSQHLIDSLHREFDMTDLGALNYFLSISVVRHSTVQTGPDGVLVQDNLLSWFAKRQHTLLRSSAEAEYRGAANVVAETAWLRNLLCRLHSLLSTATLVYRDNVSAIYMSANPVQHQQTKHIEIDIHFVRDMVTAGQVRVLHVPSRFQYADIFTKGLPSALFEEFRSSLSIRPSPAPTAGACITSEQLKDWVKWLALATPFEVVYGQSPPTHVSYMAGDSHVKAMDRTLVAREFAIALL